MFDFSFLASALQVVLFQYIIVGTAVLGVVLFVRELMRDA